MTIPHRTQRVYREWTLGRRWLPSLLLLWVTAASPQIVLAQDDPDDASKDTVLTGIVVDADGQPVSGATVEGRAHRDLRETTTDADGRFELAVPTARLRGLHIVARVEGDRFMAGHRLAWQIDNGKALELIRLELQPAVSIDVQVVDADGQPVPGADAGVLADYNAIAQGTTDAEGRVTFSIPAEMMLHAVYALKSGLGLDYRTFFDPNKARNGQPQDEVDLSQPVQLRFDGARTIRVQVLNAASGQPLQGIGVYPWLVKKPGEPDELNLSRFVNETSSETDAEGVATFDWLPTWDERSSLTFWPTHSDYVHKRGTYEYATGDGTLTIRLHKLMPLRGRVFLPDGQLAAGISVHAVGDGYTFDNFRRTALTDGDGRYEIKAAPDMLYLLLVDDDQWAAAPRDAFVVKPGQPIDDFDFNLRPATRLFGQVTVGPDKKPVEGLQISCYQYGKGLYELEDVELPNPENSRSAVRPMYVRWEKTDAEGRFEFFVGPGEYDLRGPRQLEIEKFTITDDESREFNFHSPRPEEGPLRGLVVAGDPPQPVPHAKVYGVYRHPLAGRDLEITADEHGRFDVTRELHRTVLHAKNPDGTLAGVVEIGPDDDEVTIPIDVLAAARGRVIDEATGEPLAAGREIVYGVKVPIGDDDAPWRTSFGGKTTVDEEGRFTLGRLIIGQLYSVNVTQEDGHSRSRVGTITPESAEDIELGDLILEEPYRPPTLAERIERAFESNQPLDERLTASLRDAHIGRMRVLVVFADPQAEASRQLFALRFDNRDVRRALDDYRLLSVATAGEGLSAALTLADKLHVRLDDLAEPRLVVLSADNAKLAELMATELTTDGTIDRETLLAFLADHALPPLDARELLDDALARAKRENKRVIVQETATWCAPCWRLSRFLHAHKDVFEKDYIHVKLDHRWRHWQDVLDPLQEEPAGVPWTVILDAEGSRLITSDGPDGNIGFPSSPQGVAHFLAMLQKTAIRLTADDLAEIEQALTDDR